MAAVLGDVASAVFKAATGSDQQAAAVSASAPEWSVAFCWLGVCHVEQSKNPNICHHAATKQGRSCLTSKACEQGGPPQSGESVLKTSAHPTTLLFHVGFKFAALFV
eukprot:3081468-Rhodomonas_salina.1